MASKISDEAARLFIEEGYACSEATLLAFAKRNGLDTAYVKLATGFGAGIGRKSSLCGALTGGVLALGLKHGRTSAKDNSSKEKTLELSGKYYGAFEKEFGAVSCKELCGCDLSTSKGRKKFKDCNVRREVCANIVGRASELLAEIDGEAR